MEEAVTRAEGIGAVRWVPLVFFAASMVQPVEREGGSRVRRNVRGDQGREEVPVSGRGGGDIDGVDPFGRRVPGADAGANAGRHEVGGCEPILGTASAMGRDRYVPDGGGGVGGIVVGMNSRFQGAQRPGSKVKNDGRAK